MLCRLKSYCIPESLQEKFKPDLPRASCMWMCGGRTHFSRKWMPTTAVTVASELLLNMNTISDISQDGLLCQCFLPLGARRSGGTGGTGWMWWDFFLLDRCCTVKFRIHCALLLWVLFSLSRSGKPQVFSPIPEEVPHVTSNLSEYLVLLPNWISIAGNPKGAFYRSRHHDQENAHLERVAPSPYGGWPSSFRSGVWVGLATFGFS